MKAEKERNGLVIERAVYYIRGEREAMNDQNSLDVTVPIQFWVNDSTLHLFNVSKRSSMLGFFDLIKFSSSAAAAASENAEMPSENSSSRSYGKMQVLVIWAHVAALTGAFAFLLH